MATKKHSSSSPNPARRTDLVNALERELLFLQDLMEIAQDRIINGTTNGKLVALMDSIMPRMKFARQLTDRLAGALEVRRG